MTKKEELKQKILLALQERIGKNNSLPLPALDEKRKKVINLIYKKLIADGKITEKSINAKIDEALRIMKEQTKMNDVNVFAGIKEAFAEVSEKQTKEIIKAQKEKPSWHKDFPKFPSEMKVNNFPSEIKIKNLPEEIIVKRNEKERKSDFDLLSSLLSTMFTSLVDFLSKLSKNVFKVRLPEEHYLTPQKVVLIDPRTMKAFNLKDLQNNPQVVVNESGGYLRVLQLKNKAGQEINPASEEGLAELKSLLEDIKTNTADINVNIGDVDVNTDALESKTDEVISNQGIGIELIRTLQELSSRLVVLSAVRGISADLRVTPLSTPNMSTLTTLTNLRNAGGYPLNTQIPNANNLLATLSNINNISIS